MTLLGNTVQKKGYDVGVGFPEFHVVCVGGRVFVNHQRITYGQIALSYARNTSSGVYIGTCSSILIRSRTLPVLLVTVL